VLEKRLSRSTILQIGSADDHTWGQIAWSSLSYRDDERANRKIDIGDQTAPLRRVSSMTHADPEEVARTAAVDFARRLVPYRQAALGTELLGAYLIGSPVTFLAVHSYTDGCRRLWRQSK
jgi:hypothetical protein